MKKKNLVVLIVIILIFIYAERLPVTYMENYNIPSGFGVDIVKGPDNYIEYRIPASTYNYSTLGRLKMGGVGARKTTVAQTSIESSRLQTGEGPTIGASREERQLKSNRPVLLGIQKIIILGEDVASFGIKDEINAQLTSAKINDRGILAVCKGKAEDLLSYKVSGYSTSSDFIEGMIDHATNYNFLSQEYTLINTYVRLAAEGRNIALPFLEIKDKSIVLSGMAMFKGEKMVYVLPMNEARIMNMLREKKSKGVLSIQESPERYIDFDTVVKRKVKCNKNNGKYEFIITLSFAGDIIENSLYKELNKENVKEFEKLMEQKIENMCNEFVENMKNSYKIDFLELGSYAAAKYGRETGVDWDEVISKSDIRIIAKVKIDKIGIGDY